MSSSGAHTDGVDEFDLSRLDGAYRDAPDEDEPVADGQHTVTVQKVELKLSKASGKKMLEWTLRIEGSNYAGRTLWKYSLLEEEHLSRTKTDLKRCGLDLERLSDLPARLKDLLDVTVDVTVKTNGDFQSVYFRRTQANPPKAASDARVF